MSVEVYQGDLFDPTLDIGDFDVVYSLGLVEHFSDISQVVAAHTRFVKPGGVLIIGMPNFRGVNGWFARRISPRKVATHNLDAMRLTSWDQFERDVGLHQLFRGFVGGFEPRVFSVWEDQSTFKKLPLKIVSEELARTLGTHLLWLRRFNHPAISGYLIGAWAVSLLS